MTPDEANREQCRMIEAYLREHRRHIPREDSTVIFRSFAEITHAEGRLWQAQRDEARQQEPVGLERELQTFERRLIERALKLHTSRRAAARALEIAQSTLHDKVKRYGLERRDA